MKLQNLLLLPTSFAAVALAGPISYGICQGGCAAVAVACYSGAGFIFGTVPATAAAAIPAVLACNSAFGTCSATCAGVTLLAPIP
ncbi:hypothetical protein C7212DRAFT_210569 [Tuber magnatum]|uniref:Cysteine-rich protein n=1 Tax=Tuber magnatum TaxID=42249 RepID=A0A317SI89_9PEZI|nr:hypothetical protein C7212DRAFT_210569 [Tuber magnatum]